MTEHFTGAIVLLLYIFAPLAAWFVYWLIKHLRRGAADGEDGAEGDA